MVNYVLSFCKITGASRIFTRNFYLPLLKPLTPKDALRTLRITGKWLLGAKIQHYIPVLLNHKQKRSKRSKNYGQKPHEETEDYTYMTPLLDPENESQKLLLKILDSKQGTGVFVYTVEDKKYNIVMQASFEVAIRDGDIIDVLVSQKNDKILVKLKDFKKVPIELGCYEKNGDKLYCGEGATTAEDEQFHHHGKYTMSLAKIFEDKEMEEEKWEQELKKILRKKRKQKCESSKAWKEMMKQIMKKFDWQKFEEDAKKVIEEIEEPATEQPIAMEIADLNSTKHVNETLSKSEDLMNQLPTLKDIPDILKNMGDATLTQLEEADESSEEGDKKRLTGVKVKLANGKECFVSGQMVHTEEGEVFVPGQTVENEFGAEYAPGITINIDNKPTLISGLIMGEEEKDPMFLPTQSTITSDGQLTFATSAEERPPPEPEEVRKQRRKKLLKLVSMIEELDENEDENEDTEEFIDIVIEHSSCDDDEPSTASSVELNSSEMEELDMEAMRLKQQQQRDEIEKLKLILLDDGMSDMLDSLEDKKRQLEKKLEELRKLSLISETNFVTYVSDEDAFEAATKVTNDQEFKNRLAESLVIITRRAATFRDRSCVRPENISMDVNINPTETDDKFNSCSNNLKILFKTALVAANDVYKNRPKDQVLALNSIVDIMSDALKADEKLLRELLNLMNTAYERNEVCNAVLKQLTQNVENTKAAKLNGIARKNLSLQDITKNIDKILEDSIVNTAFTKILKGCPEIGKLLVDNVKKIYKKVKGENDAVEALNASIVDSIQATLNKNLESIDLNDNEFVEEAVSFAKALDLEEVVESLSRPKLNLKNLEENSLDMLKRMYLIRQLAEKDYSLKTAITRIKKNPECAKSDPRIRELVRESAVLISHASPIRNSRDIPYDLMKKQNLLAIEDFLMRKLKIESPVLITRGSLEAIIPKEAARGVLAGRVAYVLIDEQGVNNFKPMHMLSGVNVNKNREMRIDGYLNGVRERSRSISTDREDRSYLHAKNNGSEGTNGRSFLGRRMSSGPSPRGYAGPRA